MNINLDDELKLLKGSSFFIDEIEIKPFTIGEIVDIGYQKYQEFLNIFILDVEDILKEIPEGFEDIKVFDILLNSGSEDLLEILLKSIDFFLCPQKIDIKRELNIILINDKIINRNNWDEICKIIQLQNCVKKELKEGYNPANEEARKIIEKIKENKKNAPKPKELITLSSMISGLGWKANNINIFDVWDLTVYQLYDGLNRLKIIDDYQFTLSGIYAGTIDSGKINLKDINWMKINES